MPSTGSHLVDRLYLLDLVQDTLEVYEFKDYTKHRFSPFSRLTVKSLYRMAPHKPPGYYIKLGLSELQWMWRNDWITLHKIHTEALERLWRRNATVLKTVIPHADSIPFAMLYGSVYYGQDEDRMNPRESKRLTRAKLTEAMAILSRRQPSKMSVLGRKPDKLHRMVDNRPPGLQTSILGQQTASRPGRQRRRA